MIGGVEALGIAQAANGTEQALGGEVHVVEGRLERVAAGAGVRTAAGAKRRRGAAAHA